MIKLIFIVSICALILFVGVRVVTSVNTDQQNCDEIIKDFNQNAKDNSLTELTAPMAECMEARTN